MVLANNLFCIFLLLIHSYRHLTLRVCIWSNLFDGACMSCYDLFYDIGRPIVI